jgi:hypothetical protein
MSQQTRRQACDLAFGNEKSALERPAPSMYIHKSPATEVWLDLLEG